MNKTLIFILGLLTGAAAGSTATYFLTKNSIEERAAEEIEEYAEHCEERLKKYAHNYVEINNEETEEESQESEEPEDVRNNEGVKKYHHYNEPAFGSDSNRVFKDAKEEKAVTKEEVLQKWKDEEDALGVSEIDSEEFYELEAGEDFESYSIDYFFPEETAFWAYGTDTEVSVDEKFGKPLSELIGNAHRWLIDYTDESGIGSAYFKNESLMAIFEITIHDSTGFNDRE